MQRSVAAWTVRSNRAATFCRFSPWVTAVCNDLTPGAQADIGSQTSSTQVLSLSDWHVCRQAGLTVQATAHQQQGNRDTYVWPAAWWLGACTLGAASITQSRCDASTYAAEQSSKTAWWSRVLHKADPRRAWEDAVKTNNAFIDEMQVDPKVSVVLALALPFLSLSFGYNPSKAELDEAAQLIEANAEHFDGWEICSLLWAAARLGYRPSPPVMDSLLHQIETMLGQNKGGSSLGAQEAAMLVWALAVLHELQPNIWNALLDVLAAAPEESLDEVTLVHLYQAGMFADLDQIHGTPRATQPGLVPEPPVALHARPGAKVSIAEAPLREEVQNKLQRLPPALFNKCQQTYTETAQQAGFDGPYLIELSIMLLLSKVYHQLGSNPAYRHYFHNLRGSDLERAKQLTQDPYMLIKFKSEIANRRAQQNTFVRQLGDISRTLKSMGLYHLLQAPVEDGLVHVDIALPDYKLAFFLENAHQAAAGQGHPDTNALSGYVANETPGTKQAKLQLLEQLGWKCFSVTWTERGRSEEEKQRLLMQLISETGQLHTMQGRMNSMVHGTLRTVSDEKSRFQNASVGYHLHKDKH